MVLKKAMEETTNDYDDKLIVKGFFLALEACGVELDKELSVIRQQKLEKKAVDIDACLRANTVTWEMQDVLDILEKKKLPSTISMMKYIASSLADSFDAIVETGHINMNEAADDIMKVKISCQEITGNEADKDLTCKIYVTKNILRQYFSQKGIKRDLNIAISVSETAGLYEYAVENDEFLGFVNGSNCSGKRLINLLDQDIRCIDEIYVFQDEKYLNFMWELWFNVDEYFGTDTINDKDAWINFYTNWYPETDTITAVYEVKTEESATEYEWELTNEEQEFLRSKMENYCSAKYDCSLSALWKQHYEQSDTDSRIAAIRKHHDAQVADNNAKRLAEEEKKGKLVECIKSLKPRIDNLILVANECIRNGLEIDAYGKTLSRYKDTRENGTFVTNGITHRLGFVKTQMSDSVTQLGIDGGGYCGKWDFRTDGENTYSISNNDYERSMSAEPTLIHLKQFVSDFPEFEADFYAYVDGITGSVNQ